MCLDLRTKSDKPYNRSRTRYKVVKVSYRRAIHSPYQGTPYQLKRWHKASDTYTKEMPCPERYFGIHIFVRPEDAKAVARNEGWEVAEVRVRGFLRSGTFLFGFLLSTRPYNAETWREMKIVKILP